MGMPLHSCAGVPCGSKKFPKSVAIASKVGIALGKACRVSAGIAEGSAWSVSIGISVATDWAVCARSCASRMGPVTTLHASRKAAITESDRNLDSRDIYISFEEGNHNPSRRHLRKGFSVPDWSIILYRALRGFNL